jgi:hypothetical protein
MSANGETGVVLRGITHGAVDYLLKPVRIEELRNIWQHVVRRRRETSGSSPTHEREGEATEERKPADKVGRKLEKKRKDGDCDAPDYSEVRWPAASCRCGLRCMQSCARLLFIPAAPLADTCARARANGHRTRRRRRSRRSRAWCGPWSCTSSS